jgi:16S rRNA U1498 N3-methylase RsmE
LGKRILRSETSCFYVLSLLSFFMESKIWNYSKF